MECFIVGIYFFLVLRILSRFYIKGDLDLVNYGMLFYFGFSRVFIGEGYVGFCRCVYFVSWGENVDIFS